MKKIYIPNSLNFAATPTGNNTFLETFHIVKKEHIVLNESSPRVDVCNKYAKRIYQRLDKQSKAGNAKRYEALINIVMSRSKVFQVIALFHKTPKFFIEMKFSEFKRYWDKIMDIKSRLATDIVLRRSWIPKGDIPYQRPLGAPDPEWRVQTWLINQLLDIWITNQGGRAAWQHGGFSKKGPNTFYDHLIGGGIWRSKFIYEFDLKGYFNNISHASILKALQSLQLPGLLYSNIEKGLKSQPKSYSLPPVKEDLAIKRIKYSQKMTKYLESMGLEKVTRNSYEAMTGRGYKLPKYSGGFDPLALNYTKPRLERVYKSAMENTIKETDNLTQLRYQEDHMERGRGRDNWANLGLPGLGVPQGLSYSPLLTSIASSYYLNKNNKNLIMYMDDGLLFADSLLELNAAIATFKEGIKKMGVEIQDSKTGMVKANGIWEKDLRVIGFKIDSQTEWIWSSTRSGTVKPIPFPETEGLKRLTEELREKLEVGLERLKSSGGSNTALANWLRVKIQDNGITPSELISLKGYTGAVLANIWNPSKGEGYEPNLIQEGLNKAKAELTNKNYTFLQDRIDPSLVEDIQSGYTSIGILSTKVAESLLEWLERRGMNSSRRMKRVKNKTTIKKGKSIDANK